MTTPPIATGELERSNGRHELADEAEIIIVGAGPAGAACAALLAEKGHDVLLVDQSSFPRDKPCGDGLTRSAVAFLERMGLEGLIASSQPIEGLRMVLDYRTVKYRAYTPTPRSPHRARCIPRRVLDDALLKAAIDHGARFRQARVVDRMSNGDGPGVQALIGSEPRSLRARFVIAADGATSRLRRASGHTRLADDMTAYAVRAYFRCERALEPVFDTYMPLEFQGRRVAGYGWIFPIDAHTANIGVGYWRGTGFNSPTRIREVLSTFVEHLRSHVSSRLGELEQTTNLFGSPLGVQFHRGRCEVDGVVFLGDAARTTDPWSGEGIAYALHGAEEIAELIHARARGHAVPDAGTVLGRRFGRLGQDLSLPLRLAERRLANVQHYTIGNSKHPFMRTLEHVIAAPEEAPNLIDTPVGELLREDPLTSSCLDRVNQIILDELQTGFPFAAELLHREVRAGVGPILAVTAIRCAGGAAIEEPLLAAASALELVAASAGPIRETVDRPGSRGARLNNVLCVLITDFALSRGARQSARAGAALAGELSAIMKGVYQAQFAESRQLFDAQRSVEDYVAVARARACAPLALAARFATLTAGGSPSAIEALATFGWELGLAVQIYEDLDGLLSGEDSAGRPAGSDVRLGVYPLPVLYAAQDAGFGRQLRRPVEGHDVSELVDRLRATDGIAKTVQLAKASVERALARLDGSSGADAAGLAEIAGLVLRRTVALGEGD